MDADPAPSSPPPRRSFLTRRGFLIGSGAAVATAVSAKVALDRLGNKSPVAIFKAHEYDASLEPIIREGLVSIGFDRHRVMGRSVLLKPNLVEPSAEAPHINTHPAFIRAAVEAFRRLDASEVFVAEGQGHVRDSQYVLEQSGVGTVLLEDRVSFVDLNHDEIFIEENRLRRTRLPALYLPRSLQRADLIVSLPKMKVHHWAGVTLSMKNLFGVVPSICYGWPKNVLHVMGIPQSIMDITAAVQPDLAIVDGIIGMEGDGPIMGTPKKSGLVLVGANPVAVDATGARIMGFDPQRIEYLKGVENILGPIAENRIEQRGEPLATMIQPFDLIDQPETRKFRG
jgi:uncharacterized protein (DUF362 family)